MLSKTKKPSSSSQLVGTHIQATGLNQTWIFPAECYTLAIIFFPSCNTSNTEIQICALFLRRAGFGAWEYPDSFSSPRLLWHSWISPYPVSENESTAGPAEGISADRHKAEPFVQNTQGHLGAAELLKNMFLAEHSVDGTACSFQLTLLFNAVRFLDQVLEQYLFEMKLPLSL